MNKKLIILLSAVGVVVIPAQPLQSRLRTSMVRLRSNVAEYRAFVEYSTNNAAPWITAATYHFADSSTNGHRFYRVRLEPVDYYVKYTNTVPANLPTRSPPKLPVK